MARVDRVHHVRAHVLLCMLAYLEWHLRQRLAPLLFGEQDREAARQRRTSPVEKAQVSESSQAKLASKQTADGLPVHGLTILLADLATREPRWPRGLSGTREAARRQWPPARDRTESQHSCQHLTSLRKHCPARAFDPGWTGSSTLGLGAAAPTFASSCPPLGASRRKG